MSHREGKRAQLSLFVPAPSGSPCGCRHISTVCVRRGAAKPELTLAPMCNGSTQSLLPNVNKSQNK